MKKTLERLKQQHRHLNRLIDDCRNALAQDEVKSLKRRRLWLKDRIINLQRRAVPSPE